MAEVTVTAAARAMEVVAAMEIELTQRLDRLERANRRLRIVIVAVILIFAVASFGLMQFGTANAQPRTLDVERLNVVDQQGVVRASLFVATGRGEVSFNLNDQNGNPLISMGGIDGTAIISMLDAAGHQRVFLQVGTDALGKDRGAMISLFDDGHTRIWAAP
jgi:hypothetical protein